jgi:hypothetical protein
MVLVDEPKKGSKVSQRRIMEVTNLGFNLTRFAAVGARIKINASKVSVDVLVRIAEAGVCRRARIIMFEADFLATEDLLRIAVAGAGNVFFE